MREVRELGPDWLQASKLLAAYAYGSPPQAVAITGNDGGPIHVEGGIDLEALTVEQLDKLLPLVEAIETVIAEADGSTSDAQAPVPTPKSLGEPS